MKRRIIDCQARKTPGAERTLTFTASTEQVARDGDIIRVKGWQTEEFEKNPVFLWSHNPDVPPLGRVTAVRKKTRGSDKRLEVDVEFAGLEQLHDLAEQVYLLYESGFMRAVSVGYVPKKRKELTDEEREAAGLGPYGSEWTEVELYEVSAVSVPADTDALVQNSEAPEEVREAALAVRAAEKDTQPADTSSQTVSWVDPIREIVVNECETLGANVFEALRVEFIDQLEDLKDSLTKASRAPTKEGDTPEGKSRTEEEPEAEHSEEESFRDLASAYLKQEQERDQGSDGFE